jgi:hypothetical protein
MGTPLAADEMAGGIRSVLLGGVSGTAGRHPHAHADAVPDADADTHACSCGSHAFTYNRSHTDADPHAYHVAHGYAGRFCAKCNADTEQSMSTALSALRSDLPVRPAAAGMRGADAERLYEQRIGDDREAKKVNG